MDAGVEFAHRSGAQITAATASGTILSDDAALAIAATDAVMADIAGLLADLRGEPAPAERWDPAVHGQKETGRLESES